MTPLADEQVDSGVTASAADMMSAGSENEVAGLTLESASDLVSASSGESSVSPATAMAIESVVLGEPLSQPNAPEDEIDGAIRNSTPEPLMQPREFMSTPVDDRSHPMFGVAIMHSDLQHLSAITEASVEEQSTVPMMNSTACEHSEALDCSAERMLDVPPMNTAESSCDVELEALRLRFASISEMACCVDQAVQTDEVPGPSCTNYAAQVDDLTQSAVRAAAEEIVAAVRSSSSNQSVTTAAATANSWMRLLPGSLLFCGLLLLILLTFFYDEYQTGYNGRHLSFLRTAQHWKSHIFFGAPPL